MTREVWRWRDLDETLGFMVSVFFNVDDGVVQPRTGVSPSFFPAAVGKRVEDIKPHSPEGSIRMSTGGIPEGRMFLGELQAKKRRTGRTTRLLRKAAELAKAGKTVYVISPHAPTLRGKFLADHPGETRVHFEIKLPDGFDWRMLRPPGAHYDSQYLVDHFALENDPAFSAMYEMMTRFDA